MADPNWFYATLSQSAAALAGLIGGIMGSKLLRRVDEVKKLEKDAREEIHDYSENHFHQMMRLGKVISVTEEEIEGDENALTQGSTRREFRKKPSIPKYGTVAGYPHLRQTYDISEDTIRTKKVFLSFLKKVESLYRTSVTEYVNIKSSFESKHEELLKEIKQAPLEKQEKEELIHLLLELKNQLDIPYHIYIKHEETLVPKAMAQWFWAIVVLLVTVFMPLIFLEAGEYFNIGGITPKLFLLAIFFVAVVIILQMFMLQIGEIHRVGHIILPGEKLEKKDKG